MISAALVQIPVGVLVEKREAESRWAEFLWRPVSVLPGVPGVSTGTVVSRDGPATTFYGGDATIALHRSDTGPYRDNLADAAPLLWVVLRACTGPLAVRVVCVTADPAEGEALTGSGTDLVGAVPMPGSIRSVVERFVSEHHVDQPRYKRRRDATASSVKAGLRKGTDAELA